MKKQILLLTTLTILCVNSFSQIIFESGYFINESNKKIDCLIKNIDWENNPRGFEYKLSENATAQSIGIQSVKEFAIDSVSKFIRANVKIDKSSDELQNMSHKRNPVFEEEQLFLKVLIEGKATLYIYEDGNLMRFFYKKDDSQITQLIYKRYFIEINNVAENSYFRQQLYIEFPYEGITLKNIGRIKYNSKSLEQYFINYNTFNDSDYISYVPLKKKGMFNVTLRPGLNISNLSLENSTTDEWNTDFDSELTFRFGIEAEFILPFNKNKWSIILEPTYQYYKSEITMKTTAISDSAFIANVDYKSIELPIGVRHYFFFNDDSKMFINASCIFDFSSNSTLELTRPDGTSLDKNYEIKSRINMGIGVGYKYKNKYSAEIRYQTKRQILSDYMFWDSNYNTISVIFGYSLF